DLNKSPFHIRWAGNGECDRPPAVRVPEWAREVEQWILIVRSDDSAVQHGVIASAFAFVAQARRREPHQRMEPINAARQLGADLQRPVVPRDVGEFMSK